MVVHGLSICGLNQNTAPRFAPLTFPGLPSSVSVMESLHAPWRIQYILAPRPASSDSSLFTRLAHSNDDETNYVVVRDRTCYGMLNAYPYNCGHMLVVPYKQTPD